MGNEILIPRHSYDSTSNILDVYVYLHERIVRFVLGDNNNYDLELQCMCQGKEHGSTRIR